MDDAMHTPRVFLSVYTRVEGSKRRSKNNPIEPQAKRQTSEPCALTPLSPRALPLRLSGAAMVSLSSPRVRACVRVISLALRPSNPPSSFPSLSAPVLGQAIAGCQSTLSPLPKPSTHVRQPWYFQHPTNQVLRQVGRATPQPPARVT